MVVTQNQTHVEEPTFNKEAQKNPTKGVFLDPVCIMFCPKCKQKFNTADAKALFETKCPVCGETFCIEGQVGSYRILKLIGQGGMGAIYEGIDDGLGRKVAIKVMLLDVTHDRDMFETFQREAKIVAKLNHPNVVQVYAFGEKKGHPYLVMELLPSGSLLDQISDDEPIDVAALMEVALEIASGLNAAQEMGLIHGDIKPENILFDEKMHARLVDFGLAAMNVSASDHVVWGTPYYLAPEKLTERKSNHQCDIYSLGATLYHALARRPPFEGIDVTTVIKAAMEGEAEPLSKLRADMPPEVEAIISRMMAKDVSVRYSNYSSIISDIKKYLATAMNPADTKTPGASMTNRLNVPDIKKRLSSSQPNSCPPPPVVASPATRLHKPLMIAASLLAGLTILGGAGYTVASYGPREGQANLFSKRLTIEVEYSVALTGIHDSYLKVEKLAAEATNVVNLLKTHSDTIKKGGTALVARSAEIESLGQKMQDVLKGAEALRCQADKNKPPPLTMASVHGVKLELRQNELSKRLKDAQAIKVMAEEADRLARKMKFKWATLEAETKKIDTSTPTSPQQNKPAKKKRR